MLTEVFRAILNMGVIALDILIIALVSSGGDVEWLTKQKSTESISGMAHLNLSQLKAGKG
jgi:hypothetical protein